MTSVKRQVEAVLYTTGKYMSLDEIAEACGVGSVGVIKEALQKLKEEYGGKEGALEIQEHEGRYKLNIKKEYGFLANKLVGEGEFDSPTIKTLAVIAYKSPVLQSEIIKIRGNKAYEHVSNLKENGLVSAERFGRSRMLKLTGKFFEYFDVAEKEVKEKFGDVEGEVRKKVAWKMRTTPEHIEETKKKLKEKDDDNVGEIGDVGDRKGVDDNSEEAVKEEVVEVALKDEVEIKNVEKKKEHVKVGDDGQKYVYDGRGRVIGVLGD